MKQECVEEEIAFLSKKILELNKKLVESEGAKSKFLSLIANELNNPMTVILGMVGHLKIVEDTENKKIFDLICEEVLNLDFRIQNLMSAAEIEGGKIVASRELTNIQDILDDVLFSLRYLIKNNQMHMIITNHIEDKVVIDSKKVFIILRNLLCNAALYGDEKGKVEVEARIEENFLIFRVRNEGKGPHIDYKPQIFTRFAKGPKAETGLGIGLSIVREFAVFFGGDVDYKICEGCVEFTVKLMLTQEVEDSLACGSNEFFFDSFDDAIEM